MPLYNEFETETSYKYLQQIIKILEEPICLLGGWAVYLTVNDNFNKNQGRNYLGSRDIYDLWFLSKKNIIIDISLVNKKLKIYGLTFNLEAFLEKISEKRNMWKRDLQDLLIGTLPEFNIVVNELEVWCRTWA